MNSISTVAAVSTPFGKGGVSLIRISGPEAVEICDRVFSARDGRSACQAEPAKLRRGDIRFGDKIIDDGMAAVFFAPRSYTGEDVVELTCHGGILLTKTVLEAIFAAGATPAGPGEFTRRAFLNGKLSLSQAEAVIDLIDAESDAQLRLAGAQERGVFKKQAADLYDRVMRLVSSSYAYVDFPDEDMTDLSVEQLKQALTEISSDMHRLLATYRTGKAISHGIKTAIVGKPNTGKSSLLNALLGEERAIVTDVAGTTRDTVEETAVLGKVTLRLCDTAGIHETADRVESIGIDRSLKKLQEAELIFCVFDASRPLEQDDFSLIDEMKKSNAVRVALLNKSDLPAVRDKEDLHDVFDEIIPISCATGAGLDQLRALPEQCFVDGSLDYATDAVVTNARQFGALHAALSSVDSALASLNAGMTQDIAGMDLELALSHLGELDGREVTQEVVDTIFHRFCVGK